jgi:hypothetical protein
VTQSEPVDLERFAAHLAANHVPNTVIIDCTAAGEMKVDDGRAGHRERRRAGLRRCPTLMLRSLENTTAAAAAALAAAPAV